MSLVAVCSRSFGRHPELRRRLLARFPRVRFHEDETVLEGPALVEFLAGAERAIISLQHVDGAVLDQLPDLRVISKYGVGLDRIDQQALAERGIALGWTGGVNRRAVAELVVCFAIDLLRGVHRSRRDLEEGRWRPVAGRELGRATLGIIGCGHIGKEVARLTRAFGTTVLAHDLLDFPDFYRQHGVRPVGLDELLSTSDLVSLHLPLDDSTRGILHRDRLGLLRADACLINTARGGLVDELALAEALASGRLQAAAFDVFETEPPTDRRLLDLPNFVATAHIAGSSREGILAMGQAAIDGLGPAPVAAP